MHTKLQQNGSNYQVELKNAYVEYLDEIPWDYFLTGTTRYDLTLKSARRLIERWYEKVRLEGQSKLFWVAEPFELKDGHHLHGLLQMPGTGPQYFNVMVNWWQWATGNQEGSKENWNALNLKKFDPKRNASGYCSKYLLKAHSDYDILF